MFIGELFRRKDSREKESKRELEKYFERVIVVTSRIITTPNEIVTADPEYYEGYRLRPGQTLNKGVLSAMSQHGIQAETLYMKSKSSSGKDIITHFHLFDGAAITSRDSQGNQRDSGTLEMDQLSVHVGVRSFLNSGKPYMDFGGEKRRMAVQTYTPTEVIIRTNSSLSSSEVMESKLTKVGIAQDYHSSAHRH